MKKGDLVRDRSVSHCPVVRLVGLSERTFSLPNIWIVNSQTRPARVPRRYEVHESWLQPLTPLEVLAREASR